jgi:homoserine kinase type II
MAAVTPLNDLDLEELLLRYGLGELESYWPATNGIENSNYFVRLTSPGGNRDVILTMLEQPANAPSLLVPLLDLCDDAGLPVPRVIRNSGGAASDQLRGKQTILCPRLNGRHVFNPTLPQCEAIGRFLGRLHITARPLTETAPWHPRNAVWLAEHAEVLKGYMPWDTYRLLTDAIETTTSLLGRADVRALPQGVIHGDLFRDNALFTERGLSGVLDFHHAARGFLLFDLAVAGNDWCASSDGVLDPDKTLAMFKGYHAVRQLTAPELWFFPAFALYAALAFWVSRLSVAMRRDAGSNVRFKNPEEFQHIVAQATAHFFYLDPRVLDI